MKRRILFLMALWAPIPLAAATAAAVPDYRVVARIAADGAGWDYASVDPSTDQIFVARSDGATVLTPDRAAAPAHWGPVSHGHAVVPLASAGLLAVTSGRDGRLVLFDLHSGARIGDIPVGEGPDAAIATADGRQVLVMNAKGGTVSVVDVAGRRVVRTIVLKPGLEFAALDKRGSLFVNNEDLSLIHVADPRTGDVGASIALPGCEAPSGLAYDARTDRLIAACANGKAAIIDAAARRMTGLITIDHGPDAVLVDSIRRRAFIPCGRDGTLVVIDLDHRGGPAVAKTVPTETGARTGALDPRDGSLYLPTARFGPRPASGGRPPIIPDSFHVLVLRPVGQP